MKEGSYAVIPVMQEMPFDFSISCFLQHLDSNYSPLNIYTFIFVYIFSGSKSSSFKSKCIIWSSPKFFGCEFVT